MEDDAFDAIMGSLNAKQPSDLQKQTAKEVREELRFSKQDFMSLSLQQVTYLMTKLLEDPRVQELLRQDLKITLGELVAKSARRTRSDKGMPRKKPEVQPAHVDDDAGPDGGAYDLGEVENNEQVA